jgi:hypothetical protein
VGVEAVACDGFAVGVAGPPVDVFASDPVVLDVHFIEAFGEGIAIGGDLGGGNLDLN